MMDKENIKTAVGLILAVIALAVITYVEMVVRPSYFIKSAVKMCILLAAAGAYCIFTGSSFLKTIRLKKIRIPRRLVLVMAAAYVGFIIVFLLFRGFLDLGSIRQSLMTKEGLTRGNCIFIFIYIIVINSFLEEMFFRGFVYSVSESSFGKKGAYIISALLFAFYHIGIVSGWMSAFLLIMCIAGLAIIGAVLQYISVRCESIAISWLIHGCANLAINTVGFLLIFDMIQ